MHNKCRKSLGSPMSSQESTKGKLSSLPSFFEGKNNLWDYLIIAVHHCWIFPADRTISNKIFGGKERKLARLVPLLFFSHGAFYDHRNYVNNISVVYLLIYTPDRWRLSKGRTLVCLFSVVSPVPGTLNDFWLSKGECWIKKRDCTDRRKSQVLFPISNPMVPF